MNKKFAKNFYLLSFIMGALAYYMFLSYSQMAGGKYIVFIPVRDNGEIIEDEFNKGCIFFVEILQKVPFFTLFTDNKVVRLYFMG